MGNFWIVSLLHSVSDITVMASYSASFPKLYPKLPDTCHNAYNRMLVEANGPLQTKEFPEVECTVTQSTHPRVSLYSHASLNDGDTF